MTQLFEFEEDPKALPEWKTEWRNMPEFYQEDQKPYHRVRVFFRDQESVDKFAELIGQKITDKTVSAHYPYKPVLRAKHLHWIQR